MPFEACIPMPLQIVIDDVGWRRGYDGSPRNEPFRTGVNRLHVPDDYRAIVELGRRLNVRPQCSMILSEWDTRGLVARVPSATWLGEKWTNEVAGDWIAEAAAIVRENRDHFEVTLHGIGHEYWENGRASRAEWHDDQGRMRPADTVLAKIDLFFELHEQHKLGPKPTSFVPCAGRYHFANAPDNMARLMAGYGITSLSTPFVCMHRSREPEHGMYGIDHGVLTIDRGDTDPYDWPVLGPEPTEANIPRHPILGMHWPHVLHAEPGRNLEVVDRWVRALGAWGKRFGNWLSPHTESCNVQLLHHTRSRVTVSGAKITLDGSGAFGVDWDRRPDEPMVVHLRGITAGQRVVDEFGREVELTPTGVDGVTVASVRLTPSRPVCRWTVQ